jgi:alkanesulfonate monooxygenase SsuD/methylene tetrahydromethanopterin reductase-like flavin-dependent oxidoreductase (luciferase family)
MPDAGELHLAAALDGAGWHPAAWREPGARPADLFTAGYWADLTAEAAAHHWTEEDEALVADRITTQFVGSPATVAKGLRVLQDATGADEILVTTITHAHADRVRSFELLAQEWGQP